MTIPTDPGITDLAVRRGWRAPRVRRRVLLAVAGLGLATAGFFLLANPWATWPARATFRDPASQFPQSYSPDGKLLATRAKDSNSTTLLDVATGRKRDEFRTPGSRRWFGGQFSRDGRTFAAPWIAAVDADGFKVDLIEVATGEVRVTFDSPTLGSSGVRFLEDGTTLRLLGAEEHRFLVTDVDVETGKYLASWALSRRPGTPARMLSEDGRWLAYTVATTSPSEATRFSIRDVESDQEVVSLPPIQGVQGLPTLAFSPDRGEQAIAVDQGPIRIYELPSGRLRAEFPGHGPGFRPSILSYSPDGSTIGSTGAATGKVLSPNLIRAYWSRYLGGPKVTMMRELILLDSRTGRRLVRSPREGMHVFGPDGRTIAAGHEDGTIRIHDIP